MDLRVLYAMEPNRSLVGRFPTQDIRCEVWRGLPLDYSFKPSVGSRGRPGLRAEAPGLYIWVTPHAARMLKADPDAMLIVHGRRLNNRFGGLVEIFCVEALPHHTPLSKAIEMAERVNNPAPKRSGRGGRRTSAPMTPVQPPTGAPRRRSEHYLQRSRPPSIH